MKLNEVSQKLKCKKCGSTRNDMRAGICDKCAFEEVATSFDPALSEAAYAGNIGMMEMFKFYQTASAAQKELMAKYIQEKLFDKAWDLLKQVTGVKLHD
jgi:hypothetical protein